MPLCDERRREAATRIWAELLGCRRIDLSTDVVDHESGPFQTEIDVLEADYGAIVMATQTIPAMAPDLAGHIDAMSFPAKRFLRHETVRASVHAGSHVDAPGHYGAPLRPGDFINDAPVDTFMGPAVCLHAAELPETDIDVSAIELCGLGDRRTQGVPIVLIRVREGQRIRAALIERLLDAGATVIGTNQSSLDGDFRSMFESYVKSGDSIELWPCHMLGRTRPYYQIERLRHLELLPRDGFVIFALPILVHGATAAWTRAIALVPHGGENVAGGENAQG